MPKGKFTKAEAQYALDNIHREMAKVDILAGIFTYENVSGFKFTVPFYAYTVPVDDSLDTFDFVSMDRQSDDINTQVTQTYTQLESRGYRNIHYIAEPTQHYRKEDK